MKQTSHYEREQGFMSKTKTSGKDRARQIQVANWRQAVLQQHKRFVRKWLL
jgi:hypothetical protein